MRPASSPGDPDGQRAVGVDRGDDVAVDLAHEDHPGDVEGLGVGDPQPVAELRLLAEAVHQVADLGAAAVHDHDPDADRVQQHDVGRERRSASDGSVMALPPYLTTTVWPEKRRM